MDKDPAFIYNVYAYGLSFLTKGVSFIFSAACHQQKVDVVSFKNATPHHDKRATSEASAVFINK